jgi:prepilin-type processing-associated H-X9-DG protein
MDGRWLRYARNDRVRCGGTIIDVVTVVIILVLIGAGVWWVIKAWGQATQEYTTGMINTEKKATDLACQENLSAIFKTLETYAISNESFPASQQELMDYAGYGSRLFRCPDPNGSPYVYVPGQRVDMPPTHVLVYETKPVHNGKCNVLFLGGQIEALTPEQLKQAIEATLDRVRR